MSTDSRSRVQQLSDEQRRQLVDRLLHRRKQTSGREIEPQPRTDGRFPVSYAQQRIWFLHQLIPGTSTFSVAQGLWLRGDLDRAALERALATVIARHEALRTTFHLVDGQPMQVIAPALDLPLLFEDVRGLDVAVRLAHVTREARTELRRPWDLERGPLVRARLWQVEDGEYAFFFGIHHITCDGWSLGVLLKELIEAYRQCAAGEVPAFSELPIQYADYSVWQRRWLEGDGATAQRAAWKRLLEGAPRLRLPADGTFESATAGIGKRITLPADVTQKVKALATAQGATPFMVLLAAYVTLLSRYTGQDDIVIGSPVASRTHAELENVVGCFMNPLPFRVNLSGAPTFRELIGRVGAVALDVYANQHVPFDLLVRMMDPARESPFPPLYQAMFLFHNFPFEKPRAGSSRLQFSAWPFLAAGAGDVDTELVSDQVFPITLDMADAGSVITGFIEYTSQYATALATAPEDFTRLVHSFVNDPDQRVGAAAAAIAPPSTAPATAAAAADTAPVVIDVYEAFERQAAATPDATAVVSESESITYAELSRRVAALASRLQAGAVVPDTPVAMLLERSIESTTTLLAILRAGGAFLSLDPALPSERMLYMLEHAGVKVVVTSSDMVSRRAVPERIFAGRTIVDVDDAGSPAAVLPAAPVSDAHLAYVLYTSGSSGRPKAVAIPRGALSHYIAVARERFELRPEDRVLHFASLSFDTALEEIFPTLTSGASLWLRTPDMLTSAPAFLQACGDRGLTVLNIPTAYWHELTAQIARGSLRVPASARLVLLGGEKLLAPRVREWFAAVGPRVRLLNTYGPTETTIVVTMVYLDAPQGAEDVPIGRPIPDVQAMVLDRELRPVPAGAVDELWIGGVQLARGYLNDPALTAERFIPDPLSGVPGSRLYRTGDLACVRPDGLIDFAGRADDQVKLRGFRVEPGEVEAALLQHGDVLEASVTVRRDSSGDPRLVAYVVPFEGRSPAPSALRTFLHDRVPEYMVPSVFMFLDRLPRTVQQKVDREALPPVQWSSPGDETYQPPQTQLETRIAALWAEVLERDRIGVHDNFFDLGGHSLLVIKLHARMSEELGADLSLVDLFQFPTVSAQAARLSQPAAAAAAPAAMGAAQHRAARQRQAFRRLGK